jgi:tripartite-type tricarboxylate transporter receptor subunit TctC
MKKRWVCFLIVLGFLLTIGMPTSALSAAKDFPNKPITIYVGMGAGGLMSMMCRVVASKASEFLGVPVVIVNKPGAGGSIAAAFVQKAKPDGYSLGIVIPSNSASGDYLTTKLPYKNDEFEYICLLATFERFMFASSNSPWKTLEEMVEYAKQHPGELKYPCLTTETNVIMEMLNKQAGIKIIPVPMKSDPESVAAVLGGHCQLGIGFKEGLQSLKEAGKVRILAAYTKKRSRFLPDVPTFVEKGYHEVVQELWQGLVGTKGMPKETSAKLKDAFEKALQDKEVQGMLERLGVNQTYLPGDQLASFVKSEEKRFRSLYKEFGFTVVGE